MDKRYQVFVSSTYQDLQEERQEVMQALLELNSIPSGMELFPAANDDQWTLIRRVIDDCDYYLVIIGGRYGSIGSGGLSYTEMEYRYALEQGKPIVAFLHREPESLPAKRTEQHDDGRLKLQAFRELAQQKMVKFWTTPADLGSAVSRSIIMLMRTNPATGWVKADKVLSDEASAEILRLRKEIDDLQRELANARTTAPPEAVGLAQGDELFEIHYTFRGYESRFYRHTSGMGSFEATWNEIFAAVSPRMIDEASDTLFREALNLFIRDSQIDAIEAAEEWRGQEISGFDIVDTDFQTVKVQLRALGLIVKSERSRSVKDTQTYWTLTPYGDTAMTRLRAIRSATKPLTP